MTYEQLQAGSKENDQAEEDRRATKSVKKISQKVLGDGTVHRTPIFF